MLQILRHPHLPHQLILVPIHARQCANVRKDVLDSIGELEGIDVAQTELDMSIDDELGETEDFTTKMERVSETRLLTLLCRQSLDRLQVHVVIQV